MLQIALMTLGAADPTDNDRQRTIIMHCGDDDVPLFPYLAAGAGGGRQLDLHEAGTTQQSIWGAVRGAFFTCGEATQVYDVGGAGLQE